MSWHLAQVDTRTTKKRLIELLDEATDYKWRTNWARLTKAQALAEFITLRENYWTALQKAAEQGRAPRSLCRITADECNAWLRDQPDLEAAL